MRTDAGRSRRADEVLFDRKGLRRRGATEYPSIEAAATIVAGSAAFVCRWCVNEQLPTFACTVTTVGLTASFAIGVVTAPFGIGG